MDRKIQIQFANRFWHFFRLVFFLTTTNILEPEKTFFLLLHHDHNLVIQQRCREQHIILNILNSINFLLSFSLVIRRFLCCRCRCLYGLTTFFVVDFFVLHHHCLIRNRKKTQPEDNNEEEMKKSLIQRKKTKCVCVWVQSLIFVVFVVIFACVMSGCECVSSGIYSGSN